MNSDFSDEKLYVFGYGSLIWKVDFPYTKKIKGFIYGYQRRFYQHSIDHRGTPQKPGRVVTLIPDGAESKVFGVAYEISNKDKDKVMQHLDFREKNGYEKCQVKFYPVEEDSLGKEIDLVVYVATKDNESYAGPMPIADIATQVFISCGPSGRNIDYVYNLAAAFRSYFPNEVDPHLFALEQDLKELEAKLNAPPIGE